MNPARHFSIHRPFDSRYIKSFRESANLSFLIGTAGVILSIVSLIFIVTLPWHLILSSLHFKPRDDSALGQILSIAAFLTFFGFGLGNHYWSKGLRGNAELGPASAKDLGSLLPKMQDRPECICYLQAVAAQNRSLMRVELHSLEVYVKQQEENLTEESVQKSLAELGISFPSQARNSPP